MGEQDVEEVVMESTARSSRPAADFPDAERLVKRPCAASRFARALLGVGHEAQGQLHTGWRASRKRTSRCASDLLGVSARRMLQALADKETSSRATFCPFFSA